jgi:phosphatidylserine synthase
VLIPAFALYQSGMIGEPLSFVAAGLIVVSSAIYYADMGMKDGRELSSPASRWSGTCWCLRCS